MAATMTEIAQEAKVSLPLVSRFLNNDKTLRISDEARDRIEQARVKLGGVRMRRAAAGLPKKLTYTFSMPVNRCYSLGWCQTNIGGTEGFRAFEKTLWSKDFRVSINFFDPDKRLEFLKDLAPLHCDGFLMDSGIIDKDVAQWLMENRIPHVSMTSQDDKWGVNTVYDYVIGGLRQSLEHLLDLGHRRVGFVGSAHHYPAFLLIMAEKEMSVGARDRCLIDRITPNEDLCRYRDHAREAFSRWFQPGQGPTAVICGNDYTALGVIDVLRSRGLKPGTDLSVIGYDNIERYGGTTEEPPFLTTVDVPFDLLGQRYAERLLAQAINGQWNIVHEQIPVKLVVRETTAVCRVGK